MAFLAVLKTTDELAPSGGWVTSVREKISCMPHVAVSDARDVLLQPGTYTLHCTACGINTDTYSSLIVDIGRHTAYTSSWLDHGYPLKNDSVMHHIHTVMVVTEPWTALRVRSLNFQAGGVGGHSEMAITPHGVVETSEITNASVRHLEMVMVRVEGKCDALRSENDALRAELNALRLAHKHDMGALRDEFVKMMLMNDGTPPRRAAMGTPRRIVGGGGKLSSVAGPSSPTTTPRHYDGVPSARSHYEMSRTPSPTGRWK